jgi:thiosulfate/3-mercaptopyruvate sulfurtransferase
VDYIVQNDWLVNHLEDSAVRIIDCRFSLANIDEGRQCYNQDHIPGALYCDLEKDLTGPIENHGGRHPIPNKESLEKLFSQLGISNETHVVTYDDQGGAMAARLWFLLRYAGHRNVSILDGGFTHWKKAGLPTTSEIHNVRQTSFVGNFQSSMVVDMMDVKEALTNNDTTLIDSREESRYKGIQEPIDPVAGHIPTAVNYFWKELLDNEGKWKSDHELKKRFSTLPKDKTYIVYCGSGVTACPNVLALLKAGFQNVKLYGGSWSDWCSYNENEIAKK